VRTRTSGDSPADNPPRHAAEAAPTRPGRHSADRSEGAREDNDRRVRHAAPSDGRHTVTSRHTVTPSRKNGERVSEHSRPRSGPGRRRIAARPVVIGVLLVAAASVLTQTGVRLSFGGDKASASTSTQFTVVNGTIRKASGTPMPASGTQASLWANSSTATTTVDGSGRVVFGAIGDNCTGWPIVEVKADGKVIGSTTVSDAKNYGAYPVGDALGTGRHTVTFRLSNDAYSPPKCDRNVHLAYAQMEFDSAANPPGPITTIVPTTPAPIPTMKPVPTAQPTTPAPSKPAPTGTTTAPAPAPAPAGGQPGPGNTGVPAGTKLTVHEGDLTVSTAGTVIDGLDIHGYLKIRANNVTVRRSVIRGGVANGPNFSQLVSAFPGDQKGFVIEDSTLVASNPSGWMDGLKGSNFTARRLDISRVVDTTLIFGDDVTVENSWYHNNEHVSPWPSAPDNMTHDDSLQIEGGNNIVIRNNTFEGANNTAMMITQNVARTTNVQVTGNWLSGGGCTINLSEKGKGPIGPFRLSGNKFGSQRLAGCAVIAPPTSDITLSGDVWAATGQLVTIKKGT
jgi:Ca-dependent carbohydrate-binding module xylan-binding